MSRSGLLDSVPDGLSHGSLLGLDGGAPSISARPARCRLYDPAAMRPGRDDIALPPFPPTTSWIGDEPVAGERLTARGPLLVHFFEAGELSGIRTLPFVSGLHDRYRESGLSVLGVHSPRSDLARSDEALAGAVRRLELPFPVANDREHRIWHAYGCKGWPSTFLWGRGGTLRWVHFGEGAYHETEAEVRAELRGGDGHDLPEPTPRSAGAARPARAWRSRATRSSRAARTTARGPRASPASR